MKLHERTHRWSYGPFLLTYAIYMFSTNIKYHRKRTVLQMRLRLSYQMINMKNIPLLLNDPSMKSLAYAIANEGEADTIVKRLFKQIKPQLQQLATCCNCLNGSTHLYMRVCRSVGPLNSRMVRPFVCNLFFFK